MNRRSKHSPPDRGGGLSRHPSAAVRAGFTLIEVIVAMMMTAVLVMTLYAAIRAAFKAEAAADRGVGPAKAAEVAFDLIRTDLQSAVPIGLTAASVSGQDQSGDGGIDADDLIYYGVADAPLHTTGNGDLKKMSLAVITAPNGQSVLVRQTLRDLLNQQPPAPDTEVICRDVGGFNLRYFDGTTWQDSWDSANYTDSLPPAIEVTLTILAENGTVMTRDNRPAFRFTRVIPIPCSKLAVSSPTLLEGN